MAKFLPGEKTDKFEVLFNEELIEPLRHVDYETLVTNENPTSVKVPWKRFSDSKIGKIVALKK